MTILCTPLLRRLGRMRSPQEQVLSSTSGHSDMPCSGLRKSVSNHRLVEKTYAQRCPDVPAHFHHSAVRGRCPLTSHMTPQKRLPAHPGSQPLGEQHSRDAGLAGPKVKWSALGIRNPETPNLSQVFPCLFYSIKIHDIWAPVISQETIFT